MAKTLAEIAVEAGLVSKADAARAPRLAQQRGVPIVSALVRELGVDELALVAALRRTLRVPVLDPAAERPDAEALREIPRELCRRLKVLPLAVAAEPSGARVLRLAVADPTDDAAVAEVEQLTPCDIEVGVLPLSAIEELIEHGYRGFTTEVVKRSRRPFGDGALVNPANQRFDDTTEVPATVPHHSVVDEADVDLRVRALVQLLVAKNVLADGEFDEAVRALLKRRDES